MDTIILSQISLQDLKSEISEVIKNELQGVLSNSPTQTKEIEFLTRKEASQLLSVSLPTLDHWTRTGKLVGYRIGSRIRYKRNEVEQSLAAIKSQSVTG